MSRIRGRGNKDTELLFIRLLRMERIIGWRRNAPLAGKPDFVFREKRLAVFVDGCFWHGCPRHGTRPKSNSQYWDAKLARNRKRDLEVKQRLRAAGWRVARFWEHALQDPAKAMRKLKQALQIVPLARRGRMQSNPGP